MNDLAPISTQIWDMKYRLKQGGSAIDATMEDTWTRVATALAQAEKPRERAQWAARFREVLDGFRFLPAGRIVAGAGTGRQVTLFNCFVMGTIPDSFVEVKRDPVRLRMFNLSVLVTDAFMQAVETDADWDLKFDGEVFRTIRARDLWDRIMTATYDVAEPGVIFIDRINQRNNLHYCETIAATNPCGEQPLPPYGACLLGSMNLATFVRHPFEADASLDEEALAEAVPLAVRMMDNVVDVSLFPLEEQRREALAKRRIGLGVTGLADALIMCGLRYGSPDAVATVERWMDAVRRHAYQASIDLAAEKGAFPLFDRDAYLAGESISELDDDLKAGIAKHGIRNALVTSIAPTGTISLLADNVSSGLEPVFSFTYDRTVLMPDGSKKVEEVSDFAYRLYRRLKGETAELTDAFVDAQSLTPHDHVVMQAAVQKYVDSSISKTINVPEDIAFETFKDVYREAYRTGCKGCTTYRPNLITGSVLATKREEPEQAAPETAEAEAHEIVHLTKPLDRPTFLPGATYKIKWADSDHAIYITVNDIEQDGRRRPFEVFINSKNMEHFAWTVALTRMISAVFRRGGDVSFVVDELKAVFDPRGGQWVKGRYVPSLLAAIGDVIEEHMLAIGFLKAPDAETVAPKPVKQVINIGTAPAQCQSCGSVALVKQEGCDLCTACGYSKCG